MVRCDNTDCSRSAEHTATYGFEHGPRVKNALCGPCLAMLKEGHHAVDIEVDGG